MSIVNFLPQSEFKRIAETELLPETRRTLLAAMTRINQLAIAGKCGITIDPNQQAASDLLLWLSEAAAANSDSPSSKLTVVMDQEALEPALRAIQFANGETSDLFTPSEGHSNNPDSDAWFMAAPGTAIPHGIGMAIGRALRKVPGRVTVLADVKSQWQSQLCNPLVTLMREDLKSLLVMVRAGESEQLDWNSLQHQLIAFGWQVDVCDSLAGLNEAYRDTIQYGGGPVLMICRFDSVHDSEAGSSADETPENYQLLFERIGDQLDVEMSLLGIPGLHYDSTECDDRIPSAVVPENLMDTVGEVLLQLATEHEEIVLLDAVPNGHRHSKRFQSLYPNRYLSNVLPADAASAALGLAREGLLPVLRITAAFRMEDSMMSPAARMIILSQDAGLPDVSTNSGVSNLNDIARCGSYSPCVMIQPCCAAEAYHALCYAVEGSSESVMLRIGSGSVQPSFSLPMDYYFRPGRGALLREGRDALLIAYGPVMVQRALQVAETLEKHDFHLAVVNMPWLNRVDLRWLRPLLSPYNQVFVLEDHASVGGLGDFLMRECAKSQLLPRRQFRIFGADGGVTTLTGPELFRHHELDTEYLAAEILKSVGNLRLSYNALQAARDVRKTLEQRDQGDAVRSMLDIDNELMKSL